MANSKKPGRAGPKVSIGGSVHGPVVIGDGNVTLAHWAQTARGVLGGLPAGTTGLDADQLRRLEEALDELAAADIDPAAGPAGRLAKLRELAVMLLAGAASGALVEVAKSAPDLWH
jgi:hypothetical protein